jgi:hypothetical protein
LFREVCKFLDKHIDDLNVRIAGCEH